MTDSSAKLAFAANEDPFVVARGGFYRRWLSMITDVDELQTIVAQLEATTEDKWVPVWKAAGQKHEDLGDAFDAQEDYDKARQEHLLAKTFYAIGRFPGEISPVKAEISADCARAYRKACAHLDPPMEIVDIPCDGKSIRAHFRAPKGQMYGPAVLIMCGSDVFKEDRGWASEFALEQGLASLVMDAPGTGENPFPWQPEAVKAWIAAIDALGARPEVDPARVGAFGISRGGYSVMQLAGTAPDKVHAVVANAGHPFGYRMSEAEMDAFVTARNRRANFYFGPADGPPSFPTWSVELENEIFDRWSLSELGIVDNITMPTLLINGKNDHLAPIGNIYFMLEHGPVTGREARVYANSGHCAFEHYRDWGPASFRWLAEKLAKPSA